MDQKIKEVYSRILKSELVAAMGCTEPIAIAYAAAKAREVLGKLPQSCHVYCSGNIVKNVMGVTVPNSGGMKGIDVAATLGILGGDAERADGVGKHDALLRVLPSRVGCEEAGAEAVAGTGGINRLIRADGGIELADRLACEAEICTGLAHFYNDVLRALCHRKPDSSRAAVKVHKHLVTAKPRGICRKRV